MLGISKGVSCEDCAWEDQERGYSQQERMSEIYEFLKVNLRLSVSDASTGQNYEVPGSLGVCVCLMLTDPNTGKQECISQETCSIG